MYVCFYTYMHAYEHVCTPPPRACTYILTYVIHTPKLGDVDSLRRHLLASFSALDGGRRGGAAGGREDGKADGHRRQAFASSSSPSSSSCLLIMGDSMMRQVCVMRLTERTRG
jgi:hypothetical protein